MNFACFHCDQALDYASGYVPRKDECAACGRDVHCCKNCTHYDESAYNNCREPQAERVVDTERANFCDYFVLGREGNKTAKEVNRKETFAALDDLFIKKK